MNDLVPRKIMREAFQKLPTNFLLCLKHKNVSIYIPQSNYT